ncbi:hypothetical protein LEP1GSC188_5036 [Leptospira weilii serovar Topaz str. LT2116]|uniref:Uncharacterized protein n=1 Tax=Leptospira weilii serovar Topaz str. LT2116 TaxID=1088540 RepID=M3G6B6_9LEPT|nr:hypothetical protein LEP1GSC188_5036 [Leptospira weilii serovar Topaz str. LT2116]
MARDRAFRSNSFGISTTIAFAFCYTELTFIRIEIVRKIRSSTRITTDDAGLFDFSAGKS